METLPVRFLCAPIRPAHASALVLLALAALPLSRSAAAAAPTAAETRMIDTVDARYEQSIARLERLVNQNSGSRNLPGVKAVADLLRPDFEALGFKVEWKPMEATHRAGHLIATHNGKKGRKRLLLIGHLDTVFEPDSGFLKFERQGDDATGPGVEDDKGGVSVMLAALEAMQAAGTLKDANIEVVLTGDEEDVGEPQELARADLIAAGKRADVALDFEGLAREDGQDMGSIARRSSNSWTLTTTGKSAHSSGIFSESVGDGAIYEMARILTSFRTELPEPNLTFNVGLIGGGQTAQLDPDRVRIAATGKTNIVAPIAVARGDFRTLSQDQTERVAQRMRDIVSRHSPGTDARIEIEFGYPAMAPTEGNRALLAKLNEVNATLGLAPMDALDPLKRGAGDIAFVARDTDGLIGLGLVGTGGHSLKETADLGSLRRQAKRAALLMTRLSGERR